MNDMVMKNPRPWRAGNTLVHGLICCKSGCGYWNRDVNGATNIYRIAYNAINNKERPNYLSRSNSRKRSRSRTSDQATHEEAITPQGF